MTKVIVTGMIARFPVGGNTWAYLQYVLGLKRLGYDVYYLEDSYDLLCYNPEVNVTDTDYTYCVNYLKSVMSFEKIDMSNKWAYRVGNECYGMSESEIAKLCRDTELLINVSGAVLLDTWLMREEYKSFNKKIFIDIDPAFKQFEIASDPERKKYENRSVAMHDVFFTIGENVGEPNCKIPDCGFKWNKTRPPIVLDMWPSTINPTLDTFTTVMNWRPYGYITYNGETYGHKDVECLKFIDLPKLTNQKIELAMSAGKRPKVLLDHGWKLVSGIAKKRRDLWTYQRYIQCSRAEWSVAKNLYVKTRCGWFSDRSVCYLASAKPVLLQDTGFSKYLPTGKGLIAFDDMEGILKGIDEINSDYVSHCEAARRIVEEYFDSDTVLKDLLRQARL